MDLEERVEWVDVTTYILMIVITIMFLWVIGIVVGL